jgi:hypothetical protein
MFIIYIQVKVHLSGSNAAVITAVKLQTIGSIRVITILFYILQKYQNKSLFLLLPSIAILPYFISGSCTKRR